MVNKYLKVLINLIQINNIFKLITFNIYNRNVEKEGYKNINKR